MEPKKISFGFLKTKKSEKAVTDEKKQFIECIEEKSIKIIGGEESVERPPLVIPMKPNTLVTAERLKQIAEEVEKYVEEPINKAEVKDFVTTNENETLDQMAIRELLEESKKEKITKETSALTVPIPTDTILEGKNESTLEDYEAVPVEDFGLAMLRGMGWTSNSKSTYKQPQLRPKGLGLGADKIINSKQKKNVQQDGEELTIMKNAFIKIIAGKHEGCYGKVISLDEDGRAIVELAVKKEIVNLSELMLQPVTKSEFDQRSKILNAKEYDEYKLKEESSSKKESSYGQKCKEDLKNHKKEKADDKDYSKREKSHKHFRHSKKDSGDSGDVSSDEQHRRKHNEKDQKAHRSTSESDSSDSYKRYKEREKRKTEKRDIDKKRKGKKKKRDRDRTPNCYKHRK